MFGWIINAIQRRESTKRVLAATEQKIAGAQHANRVANEHLRGAIADRRAATRDLRMTLDQTLARVRSKT